MIGHPSNKYYKQSVSQNDLKNCPIKTDDVKNAKAIFGQYCPGLKGLSTGKTPKCVSSEMVNRRSVKKANQRSIISTYGIVVRI